MKLFKLIVCGMIVAVAGHAQAYLSIGESGEIHKSGTYLLGFEPQIIINEGGGVNIGGFLDLPWQEDLSSRFSLGVGKIDFHLGAAIKYMPFPDVDRQPAMGLKAAAWFARIGGVNVWTMQIAPLFSKKYDTDIGLVTPYVAVPFNFKSSSEDSKTGTQFVVGSELAHKDVDNLFFSAEVALNLKDSYSFISGTVSFPFDSDKGIQLRGR